MTTKTNTATTSSPLVEDIRVAMRKAFNFGQTYWQQSDSDSAALNSKSDETATKFRQLVTDTCDALAAGIAQPAVPGDAAPLPEQTGPSIEFRVIEHLIAVACAAYDTLDNSEESGLVGDSIITIQSNDKDTLSAALDLLDALPDDKPGYTLSGPARASWALRELRGKICGAVGAPAGTLTQSSDRALWTDEQRTNFRANKALVYSCTECCARKGEPHLPSCCEQGICGA